MKKITVALAVLSLCIPRTVLGLSSGDIEVKLISGYFWMDNSCTAGGPQGKVVSFRIINTKGSTIQNFRFELSSLTFVATGGVSFTSGTPSFNNRTSQVVSLGNIPAGDSVTAFFFVGYNCLLYPNNTNITTDYLTLGTIASDVNSGTVANSFNKQIYVLRNANNNTISILATSTNLVGTVMTLSVAYSISNVKPTNIIDMELSTLSTFPSGYSIMGCKITASTIPNDFPVNMLNTHYSNSITSNLPSGGTVTIEWSLKITGTQSGINSSNIVPFIVSDAGSAQRWQANTTGFTGTSVPTNPITMTKRASTINNLISDTLMYTITIRNSSTVADVTIDKLVDKLPRDFQYRYMLTDTNVFPRLVTYSNCVAYPDFEDTNYLFFYGHKQLAANVFSWVIPKQDSICLIYSTRVSGLAGMEDTNFIYAYVGEDKVAESYAKVNVLTSLPAKLLVFKATMNIEQANIQAVLSEINAGDRVEVYRLDPFGLEYSLVFSESSVAHHQIYHIGVSDVGLSQGHESQTAYKLVLTSASGDIREWKVDLIGETAKDELNARMHDGQVVLSLNSKRQSECDYSVSDITGKTIHTGKVRFLDGIAILPFDHGFYPEGYLIISVYTDDEFYHTKVLNR